jgi:hypothetical protein
MVLGLGCSRFGVSHHNIRSWARLMLAVVSMGYCIWLSLGVGSWLGVIRLLGGGFSCLCRVDAVWHRF